MTGLGGRLRGEGRAGVAVGILLGLALFACSADGDEDPADSGLPSENETTTAPTTEPSPTATATSDPSGSPAPSIPDAATKHGRAGAKAFVKFYVQLENYAKDNGDVAPLRRYSHPQCGGCNDYIRFYQDWYGRGGWFKKADRTITAFDRVVPAVAPNEMYVRVSGVQEPGTFRQRKGAPIKNVGREKYTWLVWLVREQQGWRVSGLDNA